MAHVLTTQPPAHHTFHFFDTAFCTSAKHVNFLANQPNLLWFILSFADVLGFMSWLIKFFLVVDGPNN